MDALWGDIIKIETSVVPQDSSVNLTGSLGEVMKESARAALTYAKVNATKIWNRYKGSLRWDYIFMCPKELCQKTDHLPEL